MPHRENDEYRRNLEANPRTQCGGDEIKHRAEEKDRKVERWEIMMEEELAAHEKEGEIMQRPTDEKEAAKGIIFHHFR